MVEKEELRKIIKESYENIYEKNLEELRRLKEKDGTKEEIEELEKRCQSLESKTERIGICREIVHIKNEETGEYEATSFPCKLRLCPVCQEKNKEKNIEEFLEIVDIIKDRYDYSIGAIQFSNGYCDLGEMYSITREIEKAFRKLSQRVAFNKAVKGFTRILNIKYNPNRRQYKIFINMFIAVNKSYKNDTKIYISNKKWREMWFYHLGECLRDEANAGYLSSDIKRKEIMEYEHLFNYTNLDDLIQTETNKEKINEFVGNFDSLVTFRRMITYSGVFREVKSELKEQSELISEE